MRIQIEGCLTMGLGYALTEEIHFRGRRIKDLNYDTYELPRFSWLPKIETVLVDSPEVPISGGGEPAIITVGAVVANARLRRLRGPALPAPHDARAGQGRPEKIISGRLLYAAGAGGAGGAVTTGRGPRWNQFSTVPNFVRRATPQPKIPITNEKKNPRTGMNPMKPKTSSPSRTAATGEIWCFLKAAARLSPKK